MSCNKETVHTDCRHYLGYIPCRPHKREGVHCEGCPHFDPVDYRVLIIKLGAIGDVIRTTPLIHRIQADHPGAFITWLTLTPDVVPSVVDRRLGFTPAGILTIQAQEFDLLINLDKDPEACALAATVKAGVKKGFTLKDGVPVNMDETGRHKMMTGLFDDVNKANTLSYPQEIFDICGYTFKGERYILDLPDEKPDFGIPEGKRVVGLNTGCGGRWVTRLWPEERWVKLAKGILDAGYLPLFLGGEDEHEKNGRMAKASGGLYLGHFPLKDFFCLVDKTELVVTAVTMGLHIAVGLGKKVVLFNNIFNPHEFEMYGLGTILSPGRDCEGCFKPTCAEECMELITVKRTLDAVKAAMA